MLNTSELGDRLLPLEAEEESPYPTLQEVEEMSNQQIQLAHGKRELPKVDNPIWKGDTEGVAVEATPSTDTVVADELELPDDVEDSPVITSTSTQSYIGHKIPDEFLIKAGLVGNETEDSSDHVEPLYELNADGSTRGKYYNMSLPQICCCLYFVLFQTHRQRCMMRSQCLDISSSEAVKRKP